LLFDLCIVHRDGLFYFLSDNIRSLYHKHLEDVNIILSLYSPYLFRYNLSLIAITNIRGSNNYMPIIKSAVKRMKQTAVRRERNVGIKRDIKTAVKAFMAKPSAATLSKAQSEYDTAVKKGLLKKTTVARRKAGLSKAAKAAGVKLTAAPKKAATVAKKPVATKPAAAKPAAAAKKAPAKAPAAKKPAAKKAPAKKAAK
jgi:ribosomal protein S20